MFYMNQLRPGPVEWPVYHADPLQVPQSARGVAPLRHDLALARHLERRRTLDPTPASRRDSRSVASDFSRSFSLGAMTLLHGLNAIINWPYRSARR